MAAVQGYELTTVIVRQPLPTCPAPAPYSPSAPAAVVQHALQQLQLNDRLYIRDGDLGNLCFPYAKQFDVETESGQKLFQVSLDIAKVKSKLTSPARLFRVRGVTITATGAGAADDGVPIVKGQLQDAKNKYLMNVSYVLTSGFAPLPAPFILERGITSCEYTLRSADVRPWSPVAYQIAPQNCGSCLCWCPCCFKRFRIHRPIQIQSNPGATPGDGEMHMMWPDNPSLFGFNFPESAPRNERVFILMAAVLMNVFHFTSNRFCGCRCKCCHVGWRGIACIVLGPFSVLAFFCTVVIPLVYLIQDG